MANNRDDIETRFPLRALTLEEACRVASLHRMNDLHAFANADPLSPETLEVPPSFDELRLHKRRANT